MTGVSTEGYTTHAGAHSTPTGTLCRPNASLLSLLCCSNNPGMHTEAKSNEGMHIQLGFYRLSIFQPADAWLGFAAGCAGHSVISAQVLLCAADVLHPLGKSCRRAKSDLQSYVMWYLRHNRWSKAQKLNKGLVDLPHTTAGHACKEQKAARRLLTFYGHACSVVVLPFGVHRLTLIAARVFKLNVIQVQIRTGHPHLVVGWKFPFQLLPADLGYGTGKRERKGILNGRKLQLVSLHPSSPLAGKCFMNDLAAGRGSELKAI